MAGRGARIVIRLVAQSTELTLDVGLHTPLGILKEQLAVSTNIPVKQQVLQLLDLSTAEARNWHDPNDVLLEEEYRTLRELGLVSGSVLSLHSIAAPAKPSAADDDDAAESAPRAPEALAKVSQMEVSTLTTSIAPKDADHSFSGVIWDMEACGPSELCVTSVSVGGMLGRVRVFVRESSWRGQNGEARLINTQWGTQRVDLDPNGWINVADKMCAPSWDTPREIKFRKPIVIPPHTKRAIFVHSNLPDDLGIQYQSYYRDSVVAEDDHMRMLPGLGFTGNVPFDERRGWYRAYRGPAGSVQYTARLKTWEPRLHSQFPTEMRSAVRAMLCANGRKESVLGQLPKDLVLHIMEFCHHDWFDGAGVEPGEEGDGGGAAMLTRRAIPPLCRSFPWRLAGLCGCLPAAAGAAVALRFASPLGPARGAEPSCVRPRRVGCLRRLGLGGLGFGFGRGSAAAAD